ncbi:MAG: putative toxin-antitoxin system toxin component, PIN family [Bryobacteraceae bacterium]
MRVVIDTNILVSALIAPSGKPAAIIDAWLDGRFTLLTCATHVDELRSTLHKPRVADLIKPYKAGRLVNQVRSSPRTSIPCRAWRDPPIPRMIFCFPCPKAARPITW